MNEPGYLEGKFPEMQPVDKAPSVSTMNGIGTCVYGRRDFDPETGTYVTTQCLCVLFIPLLALGAYRVADAQGGGWYFLGRVPLSNLAKTLNWLLVLGILAGTALFFWYREISNPEYIADRQVARAESLAAVGKVGEAADLLLDVAQGPTAQANRAAEIMDNLLDHPTAELGELARAYQAAVELHRGGKPLARIFERGLDRAKKHAAAPAAALRLADVLRPLVAEGPEKKAAAQELADLRLHLLELVLASKPDDLDVLSELASIYEARRDLEKCAKLLNPHAAQLGHREGARILGQIYAQQEKFDQAYELLAPYAEERLQHLRRAEKKLQDTVRQVDDANIAKLKSGQAPGFDYARHKNADRKTQDDMVREYLDNSLGNHSGIKKAQEGIRQQTQVVPVALDLGIILLRRGQAQADPAARKQELEKAEKTFLAIAGVAGQSDEFRLNLGQVYYWLGKHQLGKKQFDEMLQAQNRQPMALLAVSRLLREVGVASEARALAEEAYDKAPDQKVKYLAVGQRAVLAKDQEDRITWLQRGDPSDKHNQAALHHALGDKAMAQGKDEEAARHYQLALDLYAGLPESSASLNNGALVHFALFGVTGDRAAIDKGIGMLEKAVTLKPGDSILIHNVAESIFINALGDIIGKDMDLRTLKQAGSLTLLDYLCNDQKGRDLYRHKVRTHGGVAKARAHFERVLLLAPKKAEIYATLAKLHAFTRDLAALRELHKRLDSVELDLVDANRRLLENYLGKDDDKLRQDLVGAASRQAETLEVCRKVGGPTWAAAAEGWHHLQVMRDMIGPSLTKGDGDALVKLAEEVHQATPSLGSQGVLRGALLLRAHRTLIQEVPAYAALAKKGARSLGPSYLIALALSRPGPARQACLANADVQRVLALVQEAAARFPAERNYWRWAMLQAAHPDDAAQAGKSILNDEVYRLGRSIAEKVSPLNTATIMDRFWALQLAGDEAQAQAVLQQAIEAGIPLPGVTE